MTTIPADLIVEILLRLPVRSLLRFKCICKSWLSLISDPQFAKSHFDIAAAAPTHRFLFKLSNPFELNSIDIEAAAPLLDDSASVVFKVPLPSSPTPEYRDRLSVVGSCRGFILLNFTYRDLFCFIIWNPSTGLQKQIIRKRTEGSYENLFGFGYDSSTDDYVVVNVILSWRCKEVQVQCFSLRTNSWSCTEATVPNHENLNYGHGHGLHLNGAIHWLIKPYNKASAIIAFDVMERRLLDIPLPHDLAIDLESKTYRFMVREGCLCFCSLGWKIPMVMPDTWTMKEYKVQSSWTRSPVLCTNYYNLFDTFLPVCFTGNGEILASDGSYTLARLNDEGKLLEHRTHGPGMDSFYTLVRSAMYRESLLSLPR